MPVKTSPEEAVAVGAPTHRSAEPTRRSLEALILGSLGVFVVFLDTTVVNIAFPTISRSFQTTTAHLAWVLSAYSLVFAATLIPAGRLADRYGRKRLFIGGIVGFAAMSTLCGLAPDPGVLIAGRALQGVFSALVVPTSLALILPEFPPERRHVAVGTWGMAGAAAAALGPTIGALLTQSASWRWIFLINIPVCAAIVGFGLPVLRESRDRSAIGFPDPAEIALIAAIPALLSFAISKAPNGAGPIPASLAAAPLPRYCFRSSSGGPRPRRGPSWTSPCSKSASSD